MKEREGKLFGDFEGWKGIDYNPYYKFSEYLTIWFRDTTYEYQARCPKCGQQRVKRLDEKKRLLKCLPCGEVFGDDLAVLGDRVEDEDYL